MARYTSSNTLPTTSDPYVSGTLLANLADNVTGLVYSDTSGTLYVDQSSDGTNWDYSDSVAVVGGTGNKFSFGFYGPYYRIRYIPTTDPDVFRFSSRQSSAGPRA